MQKYLHLLQIVETEKTVAKQLRQQIEDGEIEIERLKAEVKRPVLPCGCTDAPGVTRGRVGGIPLWAGAGGGTPGVVLLLLVTPGWAFSCRRGEGIAPLGDFPGRSDAASGCGCATPALCVRGA